MLFIRPTHSKAFSVFSLNTLCLFHLLCERFKAFLRLAVNVCKISVEFAIG